MHSQPEAVGEDALQVSPSEHGNGLVFTGIPEGAVRKENGSFVLFRVHLIVPVNKIPNQYKLVCYIDHPDKSGRYLIDPTWYTFSNRPKWTYFNTKEHKNQCMAQSRVMFMNSTGTECVLEIYADLDKKEVMSEMLLDYDW